MNGSTTVIARAARRATVLLALLYPGLSGACTVAANGVAFGGYNVFETSHTDSAGTITVDCTSAYTLKLDAGGSGSFDPRRMSAAGGHALEYNLYTGPSRDTVWGDGTAGTGTVGGSGSASAVEHTVYGRIPAGQNARVGSYADQITVTLEF